MKAIDVLIIDDNEDVIKKANDYFKSSRGINVVKSFRSGKDGLNYILNNPNTFDLLLMDIIMPEVDGITILEEMKKRNIHKHAIVLTSYKKESMIKLISGYDIDYYMVKPIDFNALEKRITAVLAPTDNIEPVEEKDSKLEMAISKLLHSLGIPSHIRGYQYIRESIYLMYQNPDMIGGITKSIYPEIAHRFDTTSSRVERAIRHAIEVSWNRGDYEVMEDIFGHSIDFDRSKPTNSEFIATIADNLRLQKNSVHS